MAQLRATIVAASAAFVLLAGCGAVSKDSQTKQDPLQKNVSKRADQGQPQNGALTQPQPRDLDAFHPRNLRFYRSLGLGRVAAEVERYGSLQAAKSRASLVVVARVLDAGYTRTIGGDAGDSIQLLGVVIEPVHVLAGSVPGQYAQAITVEFLSGQTPAAFLRDDIPSGYGIWFLRRKGAGSEDIRPQAESPESQYYRLVSSQGLFVQGQNSVVNPVRERMDTPELGTTKADPALPLHASDPMSAEAEKFPTLSGLVSYIGSLKDPPGCYESSGWFCSVHRAAPAIRAAAVSTRST